MHFRIIQHVAQYLSAAGDDGQRAVQLMSRAGGHLGDHRKRARAKELGLGLLKTTIRPGQIFGKAPGRGVSEGRLDRQPKTRGERPQRRGLVAQSPTLIALGEADDPAQEFL